MCRRPFEFPCAKVVSLRNLSFPGLHTFRLRLSLRHGKLGYQPLAIPPLDSGKTFLTSHARAYYSFYDMPGSQHRASETKRRTRDTSTTEYLLVLWFAFSKPKGNRIGCFQRYSIFRRRLVLRQAKTLSNLSFVISCNVVWMMGWR